MSSPATPANASRPANKSLLDYSNRSQSQSNPGTKYQWTSLSNSQLPKQDSMLLWYLSIPSPKWSTWHPPKPRPQLQTLHSCSSIKSSNSMGFQNPLYQTEMPSLPVNSGGPSFRPWAQNWQCQQHSTHRQMAKQNGPTEPWKTCSEPLSATNKTIGISTFPLLNSLATIPPMHPQA